MSDYSLVLLWLGCIGQTGFVVTWVTLPWWRHWVGRSLMLKSFSIMAYLDISLVMYYVRTFDGWPTLSAILFTLVVVGIWGQFITLLREKHMRPNHNPLNEELHHGN